MEYMVLNDTWFLLKIKQNEIIEKRKLPNAFC
jgi:hypothetical protein